MSTITAPQIQQLQTICSGKFRSREERLETLSDMAGVELTTIKELSRLQADEIIHFFNTGKVPNNASWAFFEASNTQHKAILSLCHQLGWVQEENPKLVNLNRLGGWLKSDRSPVKFPLKEMDRAQLSKIISALQSMLQKNYK